MIAAVVFDLGNVLIDWDPAPAIAKEVGRAEARRFLTEFDFRGWNHRQDRGESFERSEREAIASHPEWAAHVLAYRRNFADSLLGPIEGSVAILRELHGRGVRLFALTNWSAETFHHAREAFGWLDLFGDIVVSGEVGLAKPDAAIFHELARRTGVPLTDTFFVDDSPEHVRTAGSLGMTAVRFESPAQLRGTLVEAGLLPASRPGARS